MSASPLPEELARSAAHVFVGDLEHPELDEGDAFHLLRVLRLRDGEAVSVSDGGGGWRPCVVRHSGSANARPGIELEPVGDTFGEPQPRPSVSVAFSLTKGAGSDWVVQKLTEVGVDSIRPITSARTVARWEPARAAKGVQRMRKIVREAAMQSRRTYLPVVEDPSPFSELVDDRALAGRIAIADRGGRPPSLATPLIVTGPEGGWTDEEATCGLPMVGLGPTVLRSETAAVLAGAVLCGLRCGLVASAWGADR